MVAINMLAFNYIRSESSSTMTQCFPVIDLLATFLNAFLLPLYTMKEGQNISEYYTLPAGKNYYSVCLPTIQMKLLENMINVFQT